MLAPSDYFTMCILVAPEHSAERSVVRYEVFKNGWAVEEEKRLDELWIRIDRRLLTMGYVPPEGRPLELPDE
jgi:hypothetical protein